MRTSGAGEDVLYWGEEGGGGGGGGGTKGITRQMTSLEKVRELDEDICKVELMSRPVLNKFRAGFYVSNEVNFSKLLR